MIAINQNVIIYIWCVFVCLSPHQQRHSYVMIQYSVSGYRGKGERRTEEKGEKGDIRG